MARDYEGMIEQQERNSFLAAQDESSPWYGWDPEVVDYYRSNAPAGFGSWGTNMAPGTKLTQQQVQEVINNLNQPGHFEGINGMTLDQYLNDPRAHFYQNDNGEFIYSPHRDKSQLQGGDFVSKDRESFLESLGGIPMLAGFLAGPAMQIAGIGSLGAAGAAAGSAGAEAFGTQSFLGDLASTAASSGVAPAAAAANPISFAQDLPLSPVNTNLSVGGMNTVDELINSIASGGSQTVGSVGSGVGEIANAMGTGGAAAGSAASGGINFADSFNPVQELPSGPVNPVDTNVTSGGMNTVDNMINSTTTGGSTTVGSVGSGVGEIANAIGTSGAATGAAAGAGGASLLAQMAKAMGFSEEALKTAAAASPVLDMALRAMTLYQQGQTSDEAMKLLQQGMATSDPFGSQRGFYQDQLKQSYMDPNYFSNNPVFKGIKDMAINDVGRQAAARGYNNSSNVLHDIGSRINNEGLKYATGFQGQLGQLAGGGISPAASAGLSAQASNLATQSGNQSSFDWGNFIKSIPDAYRSLTTQTSPP